MDDATQALSEAILRDPEADQPRLDLASILSASGDPRGRFIELQVRYRHARSWAERGAINTQLEPLLTYARPEHCGAITTFDSTPRVVRGFPEGITVAASVFLRQADEMYALAPIRHVHLVDVAPFVGDLAAAPQLDRIVSLSFRDERIDDAAVERLVDSPHLRRLKRLGLAFLGLSQQSLEAIAAAREQLPALIDVNFEGNRVTAPQERYTSDWMTYEILEIQGLPPLGEELERKYGPQPWLHAPSLLTFYPSSESDV